MNNRFNKLHNDLDFVLTASFQWAINTGKSGKTSFSNCVGGERGQLGLWLALNILYFDVVALVTKSWKFIQ